VGEISVFGLLKRKAEPLGPFEFEHSIEIEQPAAAVYALVDLSDPRNAKRALGNKVTQVSAERFEMELDMCPGHVFGMTVTEVVPGRAYAFETDVTPPIGNLVSGNETFRVEPLGDSSCRLSLTIAAWFQGHLSAEEMAMEVMMMGMAGQNALAKLKVHAEEGVEAVHRLEAMQMDGLDPFANLGDFDD
jgi:uncharacterized protein YndB with AHSA1/START domain